MEKFYDRYSLGLSDMQVIVGRIKDNWRLAHLAGTSNLHVLDKFSITLQCERRIVSSTDPGKITKPYHVSVSTINTNKNNK